MTSNKPLNNETIDDLLKNKDEVYNNEIIETPDYSYGASQMPLDGSYQVRNIGGAKYYAGILGSRTNNGDLNIVGVGFTPKLIKFSAIYSNSTSSAISIGHYFNGINNSVSSYENATDYSENSRCFRLGGTDGLGKVSSVNTNGFVLNVYNPGGITYTVMYECYG